MMKQMFKQVLSTMEGLGALDYVLLCLTLQCFIFTEITTVEVECSSNVYVSSLR